MDESKIQTGIEDRPVHKEDEDEICTGTCPEIGLPPVEKLDPNDTKINNTNGNI